jgi:hypothetical protein
MKAIKIASSLAFLSHAFILFAILQYNGSCIFYQGTKYRNYVSKKRIRVLLPTETTWRDV